MGAQLFWKSNRVTRLEVDLGVGLRTWLCSNNLIARGWPLIAIAISIGMLAIPIFIAIGHCTLAIAVDASNCTIPVCLASTTAMPVAVASCIPALFRVSDVSPHGAVAPAEVPGITAQLTQARQGLLQLTRQTKCSPFTHTHIHTPCMQVICRAIQLVCPC